MTDRICSLDYCAKPMRSIGLCHGHYMQKLRGQPFKPLRPKATRGSPIAWLREAVLRETDECILWPFAIGDKGYGSIWTDGKRRSAPTVALEMVRPWHPPYGTYSLHSCDNPPCVNPAHLSWGTHAENMRQMWKRGRQSPNFRRKSARVSSTT